MLSSNLSSKCTTASKDGLRSITHQIHKLFQKERSLNYLTILDTVSAMNNNTLKRRAYDVLSVMKALNLIEKNDKEYILIDQSRNLKRRINAKQSEVEELKVIIQSLKNLIEKNKKKSCEVDKLYMPFIIIHTNKSTKVDCEITEEGDFFKILSKEKISVLNDLHVVRDLYCSDLKISEEANSEMLLFDDFNDIFGFASEY